MSLELYLVVTIIVVALIFDFLNGFHDAANSIATVVATRVLSPLQAVVWAAFFNFVAAFVYGVPVAKTIGSGIVQPELVTPIIILAGLSGAIVWNIITWYFGLPTSSSHALIGGFAGSALTAIYLKTGSMSGVLNWAKLDVIALYIVLAPLIGFILGFFNMVVVSWLFRKASPRRIDGWFRRLQLVSAAGYSLGHGMNDAQKTMGIIMVVLLAEGAVSEIKLSLHNNLWVILAAHSAIALGTMSGGWRIVKTMGQKITKLRPIDGFCAETAGASSIFLATHLGVPVSTTHVITGAISGVGAANRLRSVRWNVTLRIVWAWLLTIPVAGAIGALVYSFTRLV